MLRNLNEANSDLTVSLKCNDVSVYSADFDGEHLKVHLGPKETNCVLVLSKIGARLELHGTLEMLREKELLAQAKKHGKMLPLEGYDAVIKTFTAPHDMIIYVENNEKHSL